MITQLKHGERNPLKKFNPLSFIALAGIFDIRTVCTDTINLIAVYFALYLHESCELFFQLVLRKCMALYQGTMPPAHHANCWRIHVNLKP